MLVKIRKGKHKGKVGKVIDTQVIDGTKVATIEVDNGPDPAEMVQVAFDLIEVLTALRQLILVVVSWFKKKKS